VNNSKGVASYELYRLVLPPLGGGRGGLPGHTGNCCNNRETCYQRIRPGISRAVRAPDQIALSDRLVH